MNNNNPNLLGILFNVSKNGERHETNFNPKQKKVGFVEDIEMNVSNFEVDSNEDNEAEFLQEGRNP